MSLENSTAIRQTISEMRWTIHLNTNIDSVHLNIREHEHLFLRLKTNKHQCMNIIILKVRRTDHSQFTFH